MTLARLCCGAAQIESYLVVNYKKTIALLAGLNKDEVRTTNRCYFDVNEFSTAAYWLYNIENRSAVLCKLLSYNSRFVSELKRRIISQ